MEKLDWNYALKRNTVMLKLVGLWPEGREYQKNFYTFYTIILIFTFVYTYNFFQSLNIVFVFNDLEALTATIFISLTQMLSILKSYYLIRNMNILKKLMINLNSDMFQPRNVQQRHLAETSIKSWKIVSTTYNLMTLGSVVFWAAFPIVDTSSQERRLPFLAWYPYNYKVSPFYELTYVYQIASVSVICVINVNIDILIAALNMCTGVQCDILCDNLKHIHTFLDFNDNLIDCVKHHQLIIQFAKNSNTFFNWIVLVQFFTSVVSIAMTMFQLTMIAAFSSEFYSRMFYGIAVVVQLFMYCWFGNEVTIKSIKIPYAAFQSDWIEASLTAQKNLIFVILRSQKPIQVSALSLFYLSLDTFVTILRTSWSYFVVLCQVNG